MAGRIIGLIFVRTNHRTKVTVSLPPFTSFNILKRAMRHNKIYLGKWEKMSENEKKLNSASLRPSMVVIDGTVYEHLLWLTRVLVLVIGINWKQTLSSNINQKIKKKLRLTMNMLSLLFLVTIAALVHLWWNYKKCAIYWKHFLLFPAEKSGRLYWILHS